MGFVYSLFLRYNVDVYFHIHLTKFPTLPVIFSIYLKTDVLDFFEILWLLRTINLQNAFQFSVESARKICRYSILIIQGVILKVAKNDKNIVRW